jgi:hypothetical protein
LASGNRGVCTKKGAAELLKSSGFVGTPKFVDELLSLPRFIRNARMGRQDRVIELRLGHLPKSANSAPSSKPVLLPIGTPQTRLHAARTEAVRKTARHAFRNGAAGGGSMNVKFTADPTLVSYAVVMDENRSTYGGAYKGWSANEDHHQIAVPVDWCVRVERRGLAVLGGLMTLDAHPLMPHGDIKLFSATWARQGRGYDVLVDHGFIGQLGTEHFHAATMEEAIKGVCRKLRKVNSAPRPTPVSPYSLSVDGFVASYQKFNANVKVADARESGACEYGIRAWCASVGLDFETGEAPLSKVLEGFRALPQDEVRRAVVYAVRRERAARRASI